MNLEVVEGVAQVRGGNQPELGKLGFAEIPDGRLYGFRPDSPPTREVSPGLWLHYTHSWWACTVQEYGSFAGAQFYSIIKWSGHQVVNNGWPKDCRAGTLLSIFATAEAMPSKRWLDGRIEQGRHPLSISSGDRLAWEDEWRDYLSKLISRGFIPHADKYETLPLSAYGELPISDLELIEGPPPIALAGVDAG